MQDLMLLCPQLPDPSGIGDSVRSWRMLRHLAGRYRVHLGCFGGSAENRRTEGFIRQFCHTVFVAHGPPPVLRPSSAGSLFGGARTPRLPRDVGLHTWVERLWSDTTPARVLAISATMAPYALMPSAGPVRRILDRPDIEPGAWADPARTGQPLRRWLQAREVRSLLFIDGRRGPAWDASLVASFSLAESLRAIAPDAAERIQVLPDGIDVAHFSPPNRPAAPAMPGWRIILLAGGLSGHDAIDGALWFTAEVLPLIRAAAPGCRFLLTAADHKLQGAWPEGRGGVTVQTGVTDLRPWMAEAAVVVAPFLSRQTRPVLEAMAMGRPVVARPGVLDLSDGKPGRDLWVADPPSDFAEAVLNALDPALGGAVGRAARVHVVGTHSWEARLNQLDAVLEGQTAPANLRTRSIPLG
jgi:polysaccharide biosynthesis protein PslH